MSESLSPAPRRRFIWKLKQREIQLGERTLIVGILNVTPDSFSDGGRFYDPDLAFARALELEEQGADILDIGAESTQPWLHAHQRSRRKAAADAGAQAAARPARDSDFGGHLQGRSRGECARSGRRDRQRPDRPHLRSAAREGDPEIRRRADPESHARNAGDLGEAAAHAGRDGRDPRGPGSVCASLPGARD